MLKLTWVSAALPEQLMYQPTASVLKAPRGSERQYALSLQPDRTTTGCTSLEPRAVVYTDHQRVSESSRLLLIVAVFAIAADTFLKYRKWRSGELAQDDGGELRRISSFEVAFGIAFVLILLCIYFSG